MMSSRYCLFCFPLLTAILFQLNLIAGYAIGDDKPEEKNSAEEQKEFNFDGVWKPRGAMLNGTLLLPPQLEAITLTIQGDRYEVTAEGEGHSDIGKYLLDEASTPKRMMIKSTAGANKGKVFYAIYEIKNKDAMRVCYDLSGTDFPKDFKAPKESNRYVVGYRRQK